MLLPLLLTHVKKNLLKNPAQKDAKLNPILVLHSTNNEILYYGVLNYN